MATVTLQGGGQIVLNINPYNYYGYGYYNTIVGQSAGATLTNVDNTITGAGTFGKERL